MIDAAVAATCTATGLTTGKHCSVCDTVLVAQTVVPALGHTEVIDAAVAATCTATGLTAGKHCSVCETVLVAQAVIPANGHDWVPATYDMPKTCVVCGATEGKPIARPSDADTTITDEVADDAVMDIIRDTVVVQNGVAKIEGETIDAIIDVIEGETIVLPLSKATGKDVITAEVSSEVFDAVASAGMSLIFDLNGIMIKFDATAIEAITMQAGSNDLEIHASDIDAVVLSDAQVAALDGKVVPLIITAHVLAGDDYIGSFAGGVATIAVPFSMDDYEVEDYKVYYLAEDGSLEPVAYEYVDGALVFSTGHFSNYVMVYEPVEQESSFPMISIVILVMAVSIMLFFRMKR